MADIRNFTQGIPQNDDITIIAFKVSAETGDSICKVSTVTMPESRS
jgi:hypothetical protein